MKKSDAEIADEFTYDARVYIRSLKDAVVCARYIFTILLKNKTKCRK